MKKSNPLITIIVPMYKGELYISECIESIRNQDYKNIEIILINDGSPDRCGEIADDYAKKDSRIKVFHKKNGGVSSARNVGLNNATGEYICLIDQDDYIDIDYISYLYNLIDENDADISLTPRPNKVKSFNDKNCVKNSNSDNIKIWSGDYTTMQMLYYNLVIAPWNKMIKTSLIKSCNVKFDERFFGGEGFLFSIECFQKANKVAVGNSKKYNYRVDNPDSGVTRFKLFVINSNIDAQDEIKKHLKNKGLEMEKACKYANWHTYCDCFNTIVGCKVIKQNRNLYRKIKKVCRKDSLCVLGAPISTKEKLKGIIYLLSPFIASKIINRFRIRKFTVE